MSNISCGALIGFLFLLLTIIAVALGVSLGFVLSQMGLQPTPPATATASATATATFPPPTTPALRPTRTASATLIPSLTPTLPPTRTPSATPTQVVPTTAIGTLEQEPLLLLFPTEVSIEVPEPWQRRELFDAVVFGESNAAIESLMNGNLGIAGTLEGTGVFISVYNGPETLEQLADTIRVPAAEVEISEPVPTEVAGLPALEARITGAGGRSIFVLVDVGDDTFLLLNGISTNLPANEALLRRIIFSLRIEELAPTVAPTLTPTVTSTASDTATPTVNAAATQRTEELRATATALVQEATQTAAADFTFTPTLPPPTTQPTTRPTTAASLNPPFQTATALFEQFTATAAALEVTPLATLPATPTPQPTEVSRAELETRSFDGFVSVDTVELDLPASWVSTVQFEVVTAAASRSDLAVYQTADITDTDLLEGPALSVLVGVFTAGLGAVSNDEVADALVQSLAEGQGITEVERATQTIAGVSTTYLTFDAPLGRTFVQIQLQQGVDVVIAATAGPDNDLSLLQQIAQSVRLVSVADGTPPTTPPTLTPTPTRTQPPATSAASVPQLTATAFIQRVTQQAEATAGLPTSTPFER